MSKYIYSKKDVTDGKRVIKKGSAMAECWVKGYGECYSFVSHLWRDWESQIPYSPYITKEAAIKNGLI